MSKLDKNANALNMIGIKGNTKIIERINDFSVSGTNILSFTDKTLLLESRKNKAYDESINKRGIRG